MQLVHRFLFLVHHDQGVIKGPLATSQRWQHPAVSTPASTHTHIFGQPQRLLTPIDLEKVTDNCPYLLSNFFDYFAHLSILPNVHQLILREKHVLQLGEHESYPLPLLQAQVQCLTLTVQRRLHFKKLCQHLCIILDVGAHEKLNLRPCYQTFRRGEKMHAPFSKHLYKYAEHFSYLHNCYVWFG